MAKENGYALVRLPSGEMRNVPVNCTAVIGQVSNIDHENVNLGKAGRKRHMGVRPGSRGTVMNPCDHPHGGGEGRAPVGHSGPMTPWGKPALGLKTRKHHKRKDNEKILEAVMKDLGQITGQKAVVCRAKKSVANFKLRQGTPIGCKVTLRGERMYEFVDRFFNVALPRVRDFRGINGNGFDGRGNFACGIKEQIIFPEIDFDKVDAVRGMDVCFVTTAKTDEEGKELLKALGAPFATENN